MYLHIVALLIIVGVCVAIFLYIGIPWIYGRVARMLLKHKVVKAKALVLTFDDGPGNRLTPAILDMLADNNAKAVFFLLGRNIVGCEAIVKRIVNEGHEICSHGYDHLHYWKVWPFRAIGDMKKGWQAIDKAAGTTKGRYPFRPPYGKLNLICMLYLIVRRVPIIYWTVVSGDTWPCDKRNSQRAALLIKNTGGAVVLAHDYNDRMNPDIEAMTLQSLSSSLAMSEKTGIRILTVSQLRANDKKDNQVSD